MGMLAPLLVAAALPQGVAYRNTPATLADMRPLAGHWVDDKGNSIDIRPTGTGWAEFWLKTDAPRELLRMAVTRRQGQIYFSINMWEALHGLIDTLGKDHKGRPCYAPTSIVLNPDATMSWQVVDMDATYSANRWLWPVPPSPDAEGCEFLYDLSPADEARLVIVTKPGSGLSGLRRMGASRR